ncbi:MAG TPA: class I SAM-dependent methyltransferase [Armatimonadota bacterium]|jgi:predicted O-methyltransferase YrrM
MMTPNLSGKKLAAAFGLAALILGAAGWPLWGPAVLLPIVAAGLGLSAAGFILAKRRYADILARMEEAARQSEALANVLACLPVRAPLPPMGGWAASADFARTLINLNLEAKPRTIVELGSGVSTLISAYTLERLGGGRVVSLDHDAVFACETRRTLAIHGLAGFATVHDAPLCEHRIGANPWRWYDVSALDGVDAIDLLVIDGPPETVQPLARYPALPMLYSRLADGALILVDDGIRPDEQECVRRWLAEFPALRALPMRTDKGAFLLRKGLAAGN